MRNDHVEFKRIGQEYAKVLEKRRNVVTLKLADEREVLGIIRGRIEKTCLD